MNINQEYFNKPINIDKYFNQTISVITNIEVIARK